MSSQILPGWFSPPDLSDMPTRERRRSNFQPRPVAPKIERPRIRPEKPKREGWYCGIARTDVTLECILELRSEGLPAREIALKLACSMSTVYEHVRRYTRSSDEAAALERHARICPRCSGVKMAPSTMCAKCKHKEQAKDARAAAKSLVGERNA